MNKFSMHLTQKYVWFIHRTQMCFSCFWYIQNVLLSETTLKSTGYVTQTRTEGNFWNYGNYRTAAPKGRS